MGSRDTVDNPDFAFKNYHSLNFFTSPTGRAVPKSSVMMYPAPTGSLAPSTAFTFDFYLKPKSTHTILRPSPKVLLKRICILNQAQQIHPTFR